MAQGLQQAHVLWLGAIVLLAFFLQALTGFGSIVIALTLGALLFPIPELLPVLVALNLPLCTYLTVRHRSKIDPSLLLREILPWMGPTVVLGLVAARYLQGELLRPIFGAVVAFFAAREIWFMRHPDRAETPASDFAFRAWLLVAGLVHGVYASGGPPLVQALAGRRLDRSIFRATLMMVWLVFNVLLFGWYLLDGRMTEAVWLRTLYLLPTLPIGIALGELLHTRISERAFRLSVQVLLLFSGIVLATR
jgi:uncharacterized protein